MEGYKLRMNTKISISNIMKIVNVLFLIVLENFVLDCGMGFLGAVFLLAAVIYLLLYGGLQNSISKMVSIRNYKGLNSNARLILKPALIYVGITGVILNIFSLLMANTFCVFVWRTSFPASLLQIMFLVMVLNAAIDVIGGYQNGNGNALILNVANMLRAILPIPIVCLLLPVFRSYGQKVSAFLQNASAEKAYLGLAVACVYLLVYFLVLLIVLFLSIRMRIPHPDGRNMRTMDSKRMLYSGIFASSFKISLYQIFPLLSVFISLFLYLQTAGKYNVTVENAFINAGILFAKVLLPLSFVFLIFSEYVTREKYRLHTAYRKEDQKTVLMRAQYMIKNSFFMLLPPAMILTFLADPLVKVFFTGQYRLSSKIVRAAGILVLLIGVVHVLHSILKVLNREVAVLGIQAVSFVVQTVFLLIFLKEGSLFVVYSFYISCGIQLVLDFVYLYRILRFNLMDILIKAGKCAAAAVVMMILFIVLDKFVMMNVLLLLLSMILGYLLYYLTLLTLKGISKRDEMSLKRTLNYYPVAFLRSRLRL